MEDLLAHAGEEKTKTGYIHESSPRHGRSPCPCMLVRRKRKLDTYMKVLLDMEDPRAHAVEEKTKTRYIHENSLRS
ncbi:unnamed protein product [Dovyalis caffra]|uniref:Uncharacterized protein n=1 Tax=Dovyalis caffra TaxID=77055 RepID=A0AAV1RVX3_9ROSI|nr:unnamed protein product [Dovyalis caffra]